MDKNFSLPLVESNDQPEVSEDLAALYQGFENEHLIPLWTQIGDLMPQHPRSKAIPHLWRWADLVQLAARAGDLVPVGRGGERRAIALANPGLAGRPFATPTLWAAIQYLMPHEDAPEHRHTQHAFKFVVEGEGVWTVVNGDPVAMRRGDFLPQAGWNWHAHHNDAAEPMAWIDGLDIPYSYYTETQFFEFGRDVLSPQERATPARSRSERIWAHPGLVPLGAKTASRGTPLLAYRWAHTNEALAEQLALESEGYSATLEPGHAAVRFCDPRSGADVLPTLRCEMHRIAPGASTSTSQVVGSSVVQVFDGRGRVTVGDKTWDVDRGDMFVVPSWATYSVAANHEQSASESRALDLFSFSDAPIIEAIGAHNLHTGVQ